MGLGIGMGMGNGNGKVPPVPGDDWWQYNLMDVSTMDWIHIHKCNTKLWAHTFNIHASSLKVPEKLYFTKSRKPYFNEKARMKLFTPHGNCIRKISVKQIFDFFLHIKVSWDNHLKVCNLRLERRTDSLIYTNTGLWLVNIQVTWTENWPLIGQYTWFNTNRPGPGIVMGSLNYP